jgi:hypothetical protein
MRLALGIAMPVMALVMMLVALPKQGRAKKFMDNPSISVFYITSIIATAAFGTAFFLSWLMSPS